MRACENVGLLARGADWPRDRLGLVAVASAPRALPVGPAAVSFRAQAPTSLAWQGPAGSTVVLVVSLRSVRTWTCGLALVLAATPASGWASSSSDPGPTRMVSRPVPTFATFSRARTETELFAVNVFIKNYVQTGKTSVLDGSWKARCKRLRKSAEPAARCRLSWDSNEAHWRASGTLRGAVSYGTYPPRRFRWRFRVTETCTGESCRRSDGSRPVRRHLWKGRGVNTPA